MIRNKEKKCHCLAVRKLSALLHAKASKHKGNFDRLNCLCSFIMGNKLKFHEKVFKKDIYGIVMPSENENILEFNQCMISDKMSCIIYVYIESLIEKIDRCANNPEKSSAKNFWGFWYYRKKIK